MRNWSCERITGELAELLLLIDEEGYLPPNRERRWDLLAGELFKRESRCEGCEDQPCAVRKAFLTTRTFVASAWGEGRCAPPLGPCVGWCPFCGAGGAPTGAQALDPPNPPTP